MMQFDWLGISEAAANDHRGMLTLVGFHPAVLTYQALPIQVGLSVVALLEAEEGDAPLDVGANVTVSSQIRGPDGAVLLAGQQVMSVPAQTWPHLPSRLQIVLGVSVSLSEFGRHVVSVTVAVPGQAPLSRERTFWVNEPPATTG